MIKVLVNNIIVFSLYNLYVLIIFGWGSNIQEYQEEKLLKQSRVYILAKNPYLSPPARQHLIWPLFFCVFSRHFRVFPRHFRVFLQHFCVFLRRYPHLFPLNLIPCIFNWILVTIDSYYIHFNRFETQKTIKIHTHCFVFRVRCRAKALY